jgi:hypothetical protein
MGYGLVDANRAINTEFKDIELNGMSIIDGINVFIENITCNHNVYGEVRGSNNVILERSIDIPYGITFLINTIAYPNVEAFVNPYCPNNINAIE